MGESGRVGHGGEARGLLGHLEVGGVPKELPERGDVLARLAHLRVELQGGQQVPLLDEELRDALWIHEKGARKGKRRRRKEEKKKRLRKKNLPQREMEQDGDDSFFEELLKKVFSIFQGDAGRNAAY